MALLVQRVRRVLLAQQVQQARLVLLARQARQGPHQLLLVQLGLLGQLGQKVPPDPQVRHLP